jgi:RimJ/RimL family protein N-acetyltransferase
MINTNSIIITDYQQDKHGSDVYKLFECIYPNKEKHDNERMNYSENRERHICTKIAFVNDTLIGQCNIFQLKTDCEYANIGYHVNPQFHKMGIGYNLAVNCIEESKNKGLKGLVVQTTEDNFGSINLAKKLNFNKPDENFLIEYEKYLKYKTFHEGICLLRRI